MHWTRMTSACLALQLNRNCRCCGHDPSRPRWRKRSSGGTLSVLRTQESRRCLRGFTVWPRPFPIRSSCSAQCDSQKVSGSGSQTPTTTRRTADEQRARRVELRAQEVCFDYNSSEKSLAAAKPLARWAGRTFASNAGGRTQSRRLPPASWGRRRRNERFVSSRSRGTFHFFYANNTRQWLWVPNCGAGPRREQIGSSLCR